MRHFRGTERFVVWLFMAASVASCSEHRVDTFPEWCEQITGEDLEAKYSPIWAVVFSVSFDGDAIRDDYVKFLDDSHMEKVQNRAPRMAWREGTELHLVNLSSLLVIEPEEVIAGWRDGVEKAMRYEHESTADTCLYGTVTSLFDSLRIHSMESDALGQNWTDEVTEISTERKERLGDTAL
ncbi:hypothetical protein [Pelagibius sp.]|uniref:hypothetical protein n=1 Tax=Pelagibius sp. TaxID=1931238 RepID=UPI002618F7D0|nr:hypothetical protein [Pelagibius sp.]